MTWVASDLVRSRGSKMVIDRRRKWAGAALVLIVTGVILAGCEGRRKEPVGTEDMTDVAYFPIMTLSARSPGIR